MNVSSIWNYSCHVSHFKYSFWAQIRTSKFDIGQNWVFWRGGLTFKVWITEFRGLKPWQIPLTWRHITTGRVYYQNTPRKRLLPVASPVKVQNWKNSEIWWILVHMTFFTLMNPDQFHSDLTTVVIKVFTGVHATCKLQMDASISISRTYRSRKRTKKGQNWRFLYLRTNFGANSPQKNMKSAIQ